MQRNTSGGAITPLWIIGPENKLPQLGPEHGSGTHYAGFQGDVERTFGEVFAPKRSRRGRNGQQLRMCCRIIEPLHLIVGACYDAIAAYYNGTYRDLTLIVSELSLAIGLLHEALGTVQLDLHQGSPLIFIDCMMSAALVDH